MKCYVHTLTGARIDSFPGSFPSLAVLQATGSWARAWTASEGKLGEGLDCKRREAGRGPGLQATGSWARAWTASDGKLGEELGTRLSKPTFVMTVADNCHICGTPGPMYT